MHNEYYYYSVNNEYAQQETKQTYLVNNSLLSSRGLLMHMKYNRFWGVGEM